MSESDFITLNGRVAVIGADRHPHAAGRLATAGSGLEWLTVPPGGEGPESIPVISLREDTRLPEGSFRIDTRTEGAAPRIEIVGGPFSGVIYAVEELLRAVRPAPGAGVSVPVTHVERRPALAYRTFWTWDHSTNWELSQVGHQEIGVFNPYGKPPSGFLADYKRMVDFCSQNQIAAIVIYGFFRDNHGGVDDAKELTRYARERGVRILPGVAIGAYGGVYWEGDHPYNLSTYLDAHPDRAADMERGVGFQLADLSFPLNFPRSDYTRTACPSDPNTIDWMADALSWLVETVEPGGVNIEGGDYGVCGCERCMTRRGDREDPNRRDDDAEFWSHADMADNFPRLFEAARGGRDDLWIYCELQWDNLLDSEAHAPLTTLPDGAIYQHTYNRGYWNRVRAELTPQTVADLPTRTNVARAQFACQWNGDERTELYAFNAPVFAELSRHCFDMGMQGLTVWGEPSPFHVSSELSYLAFGRFGFDADLSWDAFLDQDVAPRLGGRGAADEFISIMQELDDHQHLPVERLRTLQGRAFDGARQFTGEQLRRWIWLTDRVNRRAYMGS
jgi:hypothetical protein